MIVVNNRGEYKVAARNNGTSIVMWDATNERFLELKTDIVDGEVTDYWDTLATPPANFKNPGDGHWYINVPVMLDGEVSDKWVRLP